MTTTAVRNLMAVALAALLLATATASAAGPFPVSPTLPAFGAGEFKSEWLTGYNSQGGLDRNGVADLGLMAANGMGLYRARFREDVVMVNGQPSQWTQMDNLVRQAALKGVTILPILINMPGNAYTPPSTDAERRVWGDFVAALVRRYGTNGVYWTVCTCTARPIVAWEVWNEPNLSVYWGNQAPDAAAYAQLLTQTRARMRATDPNARMVFGGLATPSAPTANKIDAATFLRSEIAAGGPNNFDALSVHNYNATLYPAPDFGVETGIKPVVDALKAAAGVDATGAPRQQVWVTEFGKTSPRTTADAETYQAQYYDAFLNALQAHRTNWNLGPIIPYAFRDAADPTLSRWGLRRTNADDTDAGPKLAWNSVAGRSTTTAPVPLPVLR